MSSVNTVLSTNRVRPRIAAVNACAVALLTVSVSTTQAHAQSPTLAPGTFYGELQAVRGKSLFARSCAGCHTIAPTESGSPPMGSGIPLGGIRELQKWRTVGDLF